MPVDVPILEPLEFFKDLNLRELNEFASSLNPRTVKEGEAIIRKGTPALTLYVIISESMSCHLKMVVQLPLTKKVK